MIVCVSQGGWAGKRERGPELNQGNQVWGCPLKPDLFNVIVPEVYPIILELIAQVSKANIGPQVNDTIADGLREGTNKYCPVKWRIVIPR